jgi:regulator of sigma E protease
MSIILFLAVLFVLVLVHEWGHFIAAKKTGMRVDEFGIGFPPKAFGIKKGETEYTLNFFPIGGFVRIFGENPDDVDENSVDSKRAFHARPKWAQSIVLVAGVTMNVLFAWLLFSITFMSGVPTAVDEADASPTSALYVLNVMADAPADGVLPVGAEVRSVSNAERLLTNPTPSSFSEFVNESANSEITIKYIEGETEKTASVTPVKGLSSEDSERYLVGVSLSLVDVVSQPVHIAAYEGLKATGRGLVAITVGLASLIGDAVLGQADFTNVAGPVGIVGMVGDAAAFGLTSLLTFTAIISLNLAVINLLPFPALDGGRLLFVIIEAVSGRNIPHVWAGRLNLVGFVLLMVLMLLVTYNDILRLL